MIWLRKLAWVSLLVLLVSAGFVQATSALGYGRSNYGSCAYGQPCASGGNTVVTTPSGLEVAINLTDGQVIPRTGYTIIITPLNGSGSSFAKADIYIEGILAGSATPGSNGTAEWFWDVEKFPGTQVRVVVFDTDGGEIRREFTVSIAALGQEPVVPGSDTPSPGGSDASSSQIGLLERIIVGAQDFARRLPEFVVAVFPWLLFLILLIEMMLLIWQTRRELRELRELQGLTERERRITMLKSELMQLVSHYLRTPFTILKGGAEGLERYGVAPEIAGKIQQSIGGLGSSIEGLIAQVHDQSVTPQTAASSAMLSKHYARQRFAIWLPVVLIGVIALLFVWLLFSVDRLSGGLITVLIYIAAFTLLVVGIWLVSRQLYLKKRDTKNAQAVLAAATAVQASKDRFIRDASSSLAGYIKALEQCAPYVPSTAPLAKFYVEGIEQLNAVQNKFIITTRLQGSRSASAYATVPLKNLYDRAAAMVAEPAQAKKIKLNLTSDVDLVIQNESLMLAVMRSLLDNAIAYSAEGGEVSVIGQSGAGVPTVSVLDRGSGIPRDKLDTLFQPFTKAEGVETFNHEGMGFSLYLDKLIMEYLGGDVRIESIPARETKAMMTLPVGRRK